MEKTCVHELQKLQNCQEADLGLEPRASESISITHLPLKPVVLLTSQRNCAEESFKGLSSLKKKNVKFDSIPKVIILHTYQKVLCE